jgi:hypothetical protein
LSCCLKLCSTFGRDQRHLHTEKSVCYLPCFFASMQTNR